MRDVELAVQSSQIHGRGPADLAGVDAGVELEAAIVIDRAAQPEDGIVACSESAGEVCVVECDCRPGTGRRDNRLCVGIGCVEASASCRVGVNGDVLGGEVKARDSGIKTEANRGARVDDDVAVGRKPAWAADPQEAAVDDRRPRISVLRKRRGAVGDSTGPKLPGAGAVLGDADAAVAGCGAVADRAPDLRRALVGAGGVDTGESQSCRRRRAGREIAG